MSNASLKEQLQAFASKKEDMIVKETQPKQQKQHNSKPNSNRHRDMAAKKPKPKWLEYAQYGVELLRVYFPATFKEMSAVQPLKKGIKEDLIRRLSTIENIVTEDKACMVKSLSYYVNTVFYHRTVTAGAVRVDLDGNPAGTVTEEEAKYSLERNQAKQQAKQQTNKSQPAHNKNELVT